VHVIIRVPAPLRELTGGADQVQVGPGTVADSLEALVRAHPRLRRHLFDERDGLRGYVNVFVNETEVRNLAGGDSTMLHAGDVLTIVPSIAGGADPSVFSAEELIRYSRHIALPQVGLEGQERLKRARVAIVGAGGLGSPLGLYLAAAGIGTLGLIDFDDVDASNLQRQVLFASKDIGRPKTAAGAERLRALNPHVDVVTHHTRLTSANALDVLADYDVVVDGTDNFPTRYLTNDACVLLGKPYVYGSILRFDGQVSVFDARKGPCYRCLFREPPPPGLVPSCAEGGVLGVLPGIIGSAQALEAIKLVLGQGSPLIGRLALFDALTFTWREMTLRRSPDCPVCGENPTIRTLIDYDAFCGVAPPRPETFVPDQAPLLTVTQLRQRVETGEPLQIIDVREAFEWRIANLESHGARLIPLGELPDRLDDLDPALDTVVYCRTGPRSDLAVRFLIASGFERVWNLEGGINAWARLIDPSLPVY
jgi:adenylyltransferase/sulfurtransferase